MTTSANTPHAVGGLSRLRRYTWWCLISFAVTSAVIGGIQVLRRDMAPWQQIACIAAFTLAAGVSLHWYHIAVRRQTYTPIGVGEWIAFGLAALGLAVTAPLAMLVDTGLGWGLLPGALAGAMILRQPPARRLPALVVMAMTTAGVALVWALAEKLTYTAVTTSTVFMVCAGGGIWLQWWNLDVANRLELSRRVAGELAVARERLRFAAELHDIQGHSLQVIALKSELAVRLGPQRLDESLAQMRQVQELARDALRDTRAIVAGYRKVALHNEIANATRVLSAAGITATARLPRVEPDWDAEGERLLGLLVREATTNILRHARPKTAEVKLLVVDRHLTMLIRNDGAAQTPGNGDGDGTGLTALAERFDAAGGTLSWQQHADEFTVSATLPARPPSTDDESTGPAQT